MFNYFVGERKRIEIFEHSLRIDQSLGTPRTPESMLKQVIIVFLIYHRLLPLHKHCHSNHAADEDHHRKHLHHQILPGDKLYLRSGGD